jgi:hypothetical protein
MENTDVIPIYKGVGSSTWPPHPQLSYFSSQSGWEERSSPLHRDTARTRMKVPQDSAALSPSVIDHLLCPAPPLFT